LRFKIDVELKRADYKRLAEFLKENPQISIEILPSVDFEFISVGPIVVKADGYGSRINSEVSFKQPIGFEVYDSLKLDDEIRTSLEVNRRNFKLSRIVTGPAYLEIELNKTVKTIERIVNHICDMFGRLVEHVSTINSALLDKQFDMILHEEELKKRGEVPRPFGTIHAANAKDAKERAGDLVPVYLERDKAYLYEDKKIYTLLPRDLVVKLLKLEGPAMIAIDRFTDEERESLKQFSLRRYVKTRKVGGKDYYCDLDETTRKLLIKGLMKR